jgi:hypothetical protein
VTSEGRFGPVIDTLTQNLFTGIVAKNVPPAYDVEVTFASETSPFLWAPPEFGAKVLADLNAGSIFFTYVGHGWWDGFDQLHYANKRYPILRGADAEKVDVKGTPPAMFVVACTTARFDDPDTTSVGERLLAQPNGPVAYWGATRICHPAWNALIGRQMAMGLFRSKDARIGEIIRDACDRVVENDPADVQQRLLRLGAGALAAGADMDRLCREGSFMYVLLGDPALKVALPDEDLAVAAKASGTTVAVTASGPDLPDGAGVHLSLEVPRDVMLDLPPLPEKGTDAERFAAIRARHDRANDKALSRGAASAKAGRASATLAVPAGWEDKTAGLIVKAWTIAGGAVRQGAAVLPAK